MNDFLFCNTSRRRNRTEMLHDILVVARNGLCKTRIMSGANISYTPVMKLLGYAQGEGFLEEVEILPSYFRKKHIGFKTTEKGLEFAKDVFDVEFEDKKYVKVHVVRRGR